MHCKRARRLLSEKASRSLGSRNERMLADHLRGCSGCAGLERQMEQAWMAMECYPAVEPSSDFLPRLRTRLRAERAVPPRREWLRQPGLVWQGMALAAGLVLFAVLVTKGGPPRRQALPERPAAATIQDRDRWDEQFLEDLEQTLAQSDADYLSTYDAWPGIVHENAGREREKTTPAGKLDHQRKEIS